MLERRRFLRYFGSAAIVLGAIVLAAPASADDGGHGGGHDGGGHGSGHDGGHDDGEGDDNGGNDGKGRTHNLDQNDALREAADGRIIPLKNALEIVDAKMPGKVIDVKLTRTLRGPQYSFKVRRGDGAISTVRLNAKTGMFVGLMGF